MSTQYHFLRNPKTSLYQTPAQAYMIIHGISQTYKLSKQPRKRSSGSQSHHYQHGSKPKHSHQIHQQKHPQRRQKRERIGSCDKHCNASKKNYYEESNHHQQEKDDYFRYDARLKSKEGNQKQRAISFRTLNQPEDQKIVNCNYPKQLQKQNIELRKQNKILQGYVKALQTQYKHINTTPHKLQPKLKASQYSFPIKNNFTLKDIVLNVQKAHQSPQFFTNKMYQTKGQSQQYSYHN